MVRENLYFVNAPAGSGKTFYIKEKVNRILYEQPNSNILCITYTERASLELKSRIISNNVEISTIHSFMNKFLSPFFSHPSTINFYCSLYSEDIKRKIKYLSEEKASIYREKFNIQDDDNIDIKHIKKSISDIYYNEQNYDYVLDGGISHDRLLHFSFNFLERFPIVKLKLKEMYDFIFLDEVQDTSAEILYFFYNGTKDTGKKLYLFGDKMQEIYDKYDGSFDKELHYFDHHISKKFTINYRSSQEILDVLTALYKFSLKIEQKSEKGNSDVKPRVVICESISEYLLTHGKVYKDYLKLRVYNKQRFYNSDKRLSAEDIYTEMNKIYPINSKIKPIDVLLPEDNSDNPDPLIKFIYYFSDIMDNHRLKNYDQVIKSIQNAYFKRDKKKIPIFNNKVLQVTNHSDKVILKKKLDTMSTQFTKKNNKSLFYYIEILVKRKIVSNEFYELLIHSEKKDGSFTYTTCLALPLRKYLSLHEYRKQPMVSTQHGVKGEGHDKVIFVAENSVNPGINMSSFFEIFCTYPNFNLDDFQDFYYRFKEDVVNIETTAGKRINDFNAELRDSYQDSFNLILDKYKDSDYFRILKSEKDYSNKKLVLSDLKEIFSYKKVNNVLTAYKLFYVGCSRAKKDLVVLVEKSMIDNFDEDFRNKMSECHFCVENK